MPERASDASESGRADGGRRVRSPRGELQRIEEERRARKEEARARIMEAMLEACGERGYSKVRVQDVVDRYGGYRGQFYKHFSNLEGCFDAAYEREASQLADRVLTKGAAAGSWRAGLRAALSELGAYLEERPTVARALLLGVHISAQRTRARRTEIFERLSRAIDSARRETESRHSPPPLTALFMVSAIEAAMVSALVQENPHGFLEVVPELEQLIFAAYFTD
jgi:AcrR family transcriptional regulator